MYKGRGGEEWGKREGKEGEGVGGRVTSETTELFLTKSAADTTIEIFP